MKRYQCLREFTEVAAAEVSETLVEFVTDVSCADFSYARGDVEQRKNIEHVRLHYWETKGIVVPFKDVKNAARIALTEGKLYTEAQLNGRAAELVRREIVKLYVEPPKSKKKSEKKTKT